MTLQRIDAAAPLTQLLAAYEDDGGVIVERLFETQLIDGLRTDLLRAAQDFAPGAASQGLGEDGKLFTGAHTIRFSSLGKHSDAYFDLLDHRTLAALADAVLLGVCGSYWVNTGQAMFIGPGEPAQMLHRDCDNWSTFCAVLWPDAPEITMSAMIALEETTDTNGATRVIAGSHRWPRHRDRGTPEQTVPAELRPGDALIYSGKVVHGGGANRTDGEWRRALHLSFLAGWLVPEEASALDYAEGELSGRSARVQRLLGHRSYDPRPHYGGGLWLRNVNKLEDPTGRR